MSCIEHCLEIFQGPPGPQGPTGQRGPQGPPGTSTPGTIVIPLSSYGELYLGRRDETLEIHTMGFGVGVGVSTLVPGTTINDPQVMGWPTPFKCKLAQIDAHFTLMFTDSVPEPVNVQAVIWCETGAETGEFKEIAYITLTPEITATTPLDSIFAATGMFDISVEAQRLVVFGFRLATASTPVTTSGIGHGSYVLVPDDNI